MFGVPVFYTPYFRHADIGVKRQSGLLSPGVFGVFRQVGCAVSTVLFCHARPGQRPHRDADRARWRRPSSPGGVGMLNYRQRVLNSGYTLTLSGTVEDREADSQGITLRTGSAGIWPGKDCSTSIGTGARFRFQEHDGQDLP